jgi:hypothetical protein
VSQTFQLKYRKRLNLPSGMYGLMALDTAQVDANRTRSPNGLRMMANCQPSIDD